MKKIIVLSLIVSGSIVFSGCSLYGGTPNNSTGTTVNQTPAQTSPATSNTVDISNYSFNPPSLTIKKGATVTWTNHDSTLHQIKSATFNSAALSNGQSFVFTFNESGTFDYSCAIHPSMQGQIIVQ